MGEDQPGYHRFEPWVFALGALLLKLVILAVIRDNPFIQSPSLDEVQHLREARAILDTGWIRPEAFYFAPLYPYALAALFAVFGEDTGLVRLLQVILGAINIGVVYLLAREASRSVPIARIGALLTVFYGAFTFYESLLLKTALAVLLQNVVLLFLVRSLSSPDPFRPTRTRFTAGLFTTGWFTAGWFTGCLALVRGNTLAWIPFLVGGMAWDLRSRHSPARWREIGVTLAFYGAGLILALLPTTLHNAVASHDFVLTTYQGGSNTFIGNHEGATGGYLALRYGREEPWEEHTDAVTIAEADEGRELQPSEVSRYWLRRSFRFVAEQPGAWLALTAKKLWMLVANHEGQDTISYPAFRTLEPIFYLLPVRFGWIFALAVVGLVTSWRSRAVPRALHGWWVGGVLSVALFFVVDRYRMPLVGLFTVFAALGARQIWTWVRLRRRGPALTAIVCGVAAFVLSDRAPVSRSTAVTWNNLAMKYVEQQDWDEATHTFERALRESPDSPKILANYAVALADAGRWCDAADAAGRLDDALQVRQPATLDAELERLSWAEDRLAWQAQCSDSQDAPGASPPDEAAARWREIARQIVDGDLEGRWRVDDRLLLATLAGRLGDPVSAVNEIEALLQSEPDHVDAWIRLGDLMLDLDRPEDALEAWNRAVALDPSRTTVTQWVRALEAELARRRSVQEH